MSSINGPKVGLSTVNCIDIYLMIIKFYQLEAIKSPQLITYFNYFTDWEAEAVDKSEILRLIYQGRFLHCNVTLGALGLPLGKTTVMHLVPRDNLPEPNSQGQHLSIDLIHILHNMLSADA